MALETVSAGSSSSGNSYIIKSKEHAIILDVGLTTKKIMEALDYMNIPPEAVDCVLVTHEHIDHVRSIKAVAGKCVNAVFYVSRGTFENTDRFQDVSGDRIRFVSAGCSSEDGSVQAFPLSHDTAEPLGFTITADGEKLAVVTDTGTVTEEIYSAIKDADILVLEANHNENMLMVGDYPYHLKLRIKGDKGHLSNAAAAGTLARLLEERRETGETAGAARGPLRVMLAHLSFHNNSPVIAEQEVEEILNERGFRRGLDYTMEIAARDGITLIPALNG